MSWSSCSRPTAKATKAPRMVEFGWGAYSFTGVVEQYKETLDFFSADGVPLRASVSLTLSSKELTFADPDRAGASVDGDVTPDTVDVPKPAGGGGPQGSPASIANALGAPRAARAIAAANGAPSLRFGAEGGLTVSAGAGASASAGLGLGAGIGGSAGLSAGAGAANIGAAASISGGVTLTPAAAFSAGASAGAGIGAAGGIGVSAGGGIGVSAGASVAWASA